MPRVKCLTILSPVISNNYLTNILLLANELINAGRRAPTRLIFFAYV